VVRWERTYVLAGLLVLAGGATALLLSSVLATVFFAITVAYVLYPFVAWLESRGLNERLAAAGATVAAFVGGTVIFLPVVFVVYRRRRAIFQFFRSLPATVPIEVGEFVYVVDLTVIFGLVRDGLTAVAVTLAAAAPVIALKAVLFALLVYAILWRPTAPAAAVYRTVPNQYHDVVDRLHERLRGTLYAIYVLQAATAFGTFVSGWIVFAVLGYDAAFSLAVVAGVLQFVPVVGPSVVVLGLAAAELAGGDPIGAAVVATLGLVAVGFLPDAVIRPRLARYTTGMPASLYFVGFTGGVLSLGLIGFIAGPVAIAVLAELAALLAAQREPGQQPLT